MDSTVFQRQEVTNVCCVVTRYFGGVLLGAGGLTRAYGRGAKDGLEAAGPALLSRRDHFQLPRRQLRQPLGEGRRPLLGKGGVEGHLRPVVRVPEDALRRGLLRDLASAGNASVCGSAAGRGGRTRCSK